MRPILFGSYVLWQRRERKGDDSFASNSEALPFS